MVAMNHIVTFHLTDFVSLPRQTSLNRYDCSRSDPNDRGEIVRPAAEHHTYLMYGVGKVLEGMFKGYLSIKRRSQAIVLRIGLLSG